MGTPEMAVRKKIEYLAKHHPMGDVRTARLRRGPQVFWLKADGHVEAVDLCRGE